VRPGPAPVELAADCTSCGLEAGVVEIYDALVPACRFGLPASARCKLCGEHHEASLDRPAARAMGDIAANRCPACLAELAPEALDDRRCAACGATARLAQVAPPSALTSELALGAALDAWVVREQWTSRQALLDAVFCEPDATALLARIARREPLEVLADPFANMGVRTKGRHDQPTATLAVEHRPSRPSHPVPTPRVLTVTPERVTVNPPSNPLHVKTPTQDFRADIAVPNPQTAFATAPTDPLAPPLRRASPPEAPPPPPRDPDATGAAQAYVPAPTTARPPASAPPRAIVYPLVSVVTADGEIHPAERALVDRFLASEGLAPLADDEFRVHHPSTVAHLVPKERREAVVQLMCETATIDGMPDESERRVIRAYAAAWDVPDEKVEFWMWGYENMSTSLTRQLWMKLRRFVLSARWSDAGNEPR